MLKVASWNMARRRGKDAWRYLIDDLQPDVALLQEVLPAPTGHGSGNVVFHTIGGSRPWGSAVYTRSLPLSEIELGSYHGWVVAAEIKLPDDTDLVAASVHVQIIKGHVFPHLTRIFEELATRLQGRRYIVGGDLNASRQFDQVYRIKTHGEFFERTKELGFFECHRKFHQREQQTFWGGSHKRPYQLDYLFASRNLEEQVISCDVINDEHVRTLSDHCPVAAGLEIQWRTG